MLTSRLDCTQQARRAFCLSPRILDRVSEGGMRRMVGVVVVVVFVLSFMGCCCCCCVVEEVDLCPLLLMLNGDDGRGVVWWLLDAPA